MIYWIPMNKSQSNVNSISLLYNDRRFIDAIFKCISSVKSLVFWVRIMNDVFFLGVQFSASQHWSEKWLATVLVTSHYLNVCWQSSLSLICHVHGGGHFFRAKKLIKIYPQTFPILSYTNLFQTQNMKQYWQKGSGKGRNMILIRSGKGCNIILIRAQLNRGKILLIADRAQIDHLLILRRACH